MDWRSARKSLKKSTFDTFLVYCMMCSLVSLLLFLHCFFPSKKPSEGTSSTADFPTKVLNASVDVSSLYKKRVGRLVFVLIDAFRWDFLPGRMPYTNMLIDETQACLLTARCHPPTATMPRIKALMTGSVPNYIDVALNLGNQEVKDDNIIYQAVQNGLHVLFYGDETWINLFPDMFLRSEGTTSFIVSDFKEVDLNVTRHIKPELHADDWDFLILHYLGLDHIGHMSGPYNSLISSKLEEMDSVIKTLHTNLLKWDSEHPDEPSMMIVVGDHGMHDSGSHGGATLGELLVSLILIGNGCKGMQNSGREVSQIDIAPTLATLLGLPIPKSNLGVVIPEALRQLTPAQYLYALHYNAHQVAQQFIKFNPDGMSEDSYQLYIEAQKEHFMWLTSGRIDSNLTNEIEIKYISSVQHMGSFLVNALVMFDTFGMTVGCLFLLQIFLILLFYEPDVILWSDRGLKSMMLVSVAFSLGPSFLYCQISGSISILCSCKGAPLFAFILCFSFNGLILFLSLRNFQLKKKAIFSSLSLPFLIGNILHVVSLTASSFVEEEHQTWYFFWTTMLILLVRSALSKPSLSTILHAVGILFGHRVLRKLNQTGDKWAHLTDISDWLYMPEYHFVLSGVAIISLSFVWFCAVKLECITNKLDKILYGMALMCVLLYRASTGEIVHFYILRNYIAVKLFWTFWILILFRAVIYNFGIPTPVKTLRMCISLWLLLAALLMRPHNLPLLPSILLASSTLLMFFREVIDITLAHAWLGFIWYFYQGNSNSLATIDVAAGYVGVTQQNIVESGVFIGIHTLNAPVLSLLLLLCHLAVQEENFDRKPPRHSTSLHILLLLKLLSLSACCAVVMLHQHHLFVWSVFAPKLLYEAVSFVCHVLLIFLFHVLFSVLYHCKVSSQNPPVLIKNC